MSLTPLKLAAATDYTVGGGAYMAPGLTQLSATTALLTYGWNSDADTGAYNSVTTWQTISQLVTFSDSGWILSAGSQYAWAGNKEVAYATAVTTEGNVLQMTSADTRGYRLVEVIDGNLATHATVPVQAGPLMSGTYNQPTKWGQAGARIPGTNDFIFVRTCQYSGLPSFAEAVRVTGTTVTILDVVALPMPTSAGRWYFAGAVVPVGGTSAAAVLSFPQANTGSGAVRDLYRVYSLTLNSGALTVAYSDLDAPTADGGTSFNQPISTLYPSTSGTAGHVELVIHDSTKDDYTSMTRWGLTVAPSSDGSTVTVTKDVLPLAQLDLTARPDGAASGSTLNVAGDNNAELHSVTVNTDAGTLLVAHTVALTVSGTDDGHNRLMVSEFDLTFGDLLSTTFTDTLPPADGHTTFGFPQVAACYLPTTGQYVVAVTDADKTAWVPVSFGNAPEGAGNIRLLDYTTAGLAYDIADGGYTQRTHFS